MFLTTLRFDLEALRTPDVGAEGGAPERSGEGGRPGSGLGRLYAAEDAKPKYLAWYEAADPGAFSRDDFGMALASTDRGGSAPPEAMTFRLMRDVGDQAFGDTPWLYIVHTDIPDDIIEEYNAWYDEEHLPRLVTVPGIVRARRYTALAGNPRYFTAYELTDRDAFTSPEGLVARKTPWTERMRSLFSNTRRLTCRLVVPSTHAPDPRRWLAGMLLDSTKQ